jgi:hypothetical protein
MGMFVRALIFVAFAALPALAGAQVTEIYKCVDRTGRPLYTSDKRDTAGKKCELVSREINVVPASKLAPLRFPKETAAQAASAKGRQREILQNELATEETALAKARRGLVEQQGVRADEERLQPIKDNIETHEKNIEALRRELSNLR